MPLLRPTAILRAAPKQWKDVHWPSTLNLPKSAFPARASPAELQTYRQRCADDLYAWQRAHRPSGNDFVLHDGPPYANGAVHVGHALNKVLKDLILRWELAKGRRVQYRPGWDCHGLPIELKALQQARTRREEARALEHVPGEEAAVAGGIGMSAVEIRRRARELAAETIEVQKRSFREWGVMGEWDRPYKTMDRDFETRQLGVFREMVKQGLISRHHRPVYWSPSSRTALAEAELEYDENHECTAAFVKLPFVRLPKVFEGPSAVEPGRLSALIWTTTPWTLPANMAVAVKDGLQYAVVELTTFSGKDSESEQVVVAQDRVEHVLSCLPSNTCHEVVMEDIDGSQLTDGQAACFNLFQNSESPILSADFVTATSGTGLVHMAPGHGLDDYQVCQAKRVGPALAPVDDAGRFTAEVFPADSEQSKALTGMDVQTEGVKAVLDLLATPGRYLPSGLWRPNTSLVLASHVFTHKNPIDWRTKQPVIVRATAQWFADASALQQPALASLDDVTFVPESGKNRLSAFLRGRSQWCISRQRAWGVPIPALYHKETGEACISDESIEHIIKVLGARGTDAWFKDAENDEAWIHPSLEPGAWVRGKDTMDVWFDSGTSWTTLAPRGDGKAVSDVYVEGTDQHRGWFQSSLLTHVAVQDVGEKPKAPYSKLITHGFTLDAEGRKMSKSVGNVIAPEQIIDGSLLPPVKTKQKGSHKAPVAQGISEEIPKYDSLGPDVLRLWVASSDYTKDVSIAVPLLQEVQNALVKYRVTFKWLLGVLVDFQPDHVSDSVHLTFADTAVLYRFAQVSQAVEQAFDVHAFHKGVKELNTFVNTDLSAFYFETCKDALYTGHERDRRRTQTVLALLTRHILRLLGPVLPHLVEEVSTLMSPAMKHWMGDPLRTTWTGQSELLSAIEGHDAQHLDDAITQLRAISAAVQKAQEEARRAGKVKSGLACKVEIHVLADADAYRHVLDWQRSGELADLLVVSQVEVVIASDATAGAERNAPVWRFEQPVELPAVTGSRQMKVVVVPPEGAKCVRCWKYTASEEGAPCQRCQDVLREREHVAT